MITVPTISCVEEVFDSGELTTNSFALTIRCYAYAVLATPPPNALPSDRKLAVEAMTLFLRIENEIREARADWNQDRFRRLMRLRPRVIARLRRRWAKLSPMPRIPLGHLRRRYHANLARYLNPPR